eukprot:Awhi_evm1s12678
MSLNDQMFDSSSDDNDEPPNFEELASISRSMYHDAQSSSLSPTQQFTTPRISSLDDSSPPFSLQDLEKSQTPVFHENESHSMNNTIDNNSNMVGNLNNHYNNNNYINTGTSINNNNKMYYDSDNHFNQPTDSVGYLPQVQESKNLQEQLNASGNMSSFIRNNDNDNHNGNIALRTFNNN